MPGEKRRILFYSWIILIFILTGCLGLTDVKVIIPVAAKKGDQAILRCHYDLEGDQLYSVKWYKGGREFYRFTPRENPPIKEFRIIGLTVLLPLCNETHVVLGNVTAENSGSYSCEVSADAPSFFTGMETATLQVIEVPKGDPQITGLKRSYRIGETLKADCISKESRPAANLTWLVNGEPVESTRIRHHTKPLENTLYNAHSVLRLQINRQIFHKNKLKIRCVASMHMIYYRSSERSVFLEKLKHKTHHVHPSSSTEYPPATVNWEYVLPPEGYPQSTFVFTAPVASSKSFCLWLEVSIMKSILLPILVSLCHR